MYLYWWSLVWPASRKPATPWYSQNTVCNSRHCGVLVVAPVPAGEAGVGLMIVYGAPPGVSVTKKWMAVVLWLHSIATRNDPCQTSASVNWSVSTRAYRSVSVPVPPAL